MPYITTSSRCDGSFAVVFASSMQSPEEIAASTAAAATAGGLQSGFRMPKGTTVKNRAPAPVQITAEQILREARDRMPQKQKKADVVITDVEELKSYRLNKRKHYETRVRMNRYSIQEWIKYAKFEETQHEFTRARSIFERALDVDYRSPSLWLSYADMEMRNKFPNHARNIWDRAVQLLPRVDQFWYKYAYMEEMLGHPENARKVFERWMKWQPGPTAWQAFVKFEYRYKQYDRIRDIYEKFVQCHDKVETWQRWAKFEAKQGNVASARGVYEKAIDHLGEDATPQIFVNFAEFEEKAGEIDRARAVYQYAINNLPKEDAQLVFQRFSQFEKQHGGKEEIEDVIANRRRLEYEQLLKENASNYDVWFDYARLEESLVKESALASPDYAKVREVYERAIAQVPPDGQKRYWRRYIYLWIKYALFEEIESGDLDRAREIYRQAVNTVPHRQFTFAKLWVIYSQFEIRCKRLAEARKILGYAIGVAPKDRIFRHYIQIEAQVGDVDRCRRLYERYLSWNAANCKAWVEFADMEAGLGEADRVRGIFELAVEQTVLDMPEVLWKAYIDFEIGEGQTDRVRTLYRRLLEKTKHFKVWLSFAQFEHTLQEFDKAREVFQEADDYFKSSSELKEERSIVIENWLQFEQRYGSDEQQQAVRDKQPKRVKKKRPIMAMVGETDAGEGVTYEEEYWDYIFPDEGEGGHAPNLKILEAARRWKKQKTDGDS